MNKMYPYEAEKLLKLTYNSMSEPQSICMSVKTVYFLFSMIKIHTSGVLLIKFADFRRQNLAKKCKKLDFRIFCLSQINSTLQVIAQLKRLKLGII